MDLTVDAAGVRVDEAIRSFGLDTVHLPEAAVDDRVFAYIEFHIEQRPVLESLNLPLGVVTSIVGQSRLIVTFRGKANHAGTTPMHLRRDALAAAGRWISIVERYARSTPGLVATVGSLEVQPGAGITIPGEAIAALDVRHPDDAIRRASVDALLDTANKIGARLGIAGEPRPIANQATVACDPCLVAALSRSVPADVDAALAVGTKLFVELEHRHARSGDSQRYNGGRCGKATSRSIRGPSPRSARSCPRPVRISTKEG